MIDYQDIISERVSKSSLSIFIFLYLITTLFLINENITGVFIICFFSTLFLYLIKPSVSFVFSLIPIIEPIGRISFSGVVIVFIILSCISIFFNFKKYIFLIKEDKIFKLIFINCVLFVLYQLIFTFRETNGSSYINYVFVNAREIFGVFLILPAYYLTIRDRYNLFLSFLILSIITFLYFYLSKIGIYDFFPINVSDRGADIDIERIDFDFDFRILIKIFAYFLAVMFFWEIKPKLLRLSMIIVGIMAYGVLFLMILRLELFYTAIGGVLMAYLLKKNYGIQNKISKYAQLVFFFILFFFVFFDQFKGIIDTIIFTSKSFTGSVEDSSADSRFEWVPIILVYFILNPIFGAGFYALSYDNLDNYASADVQLLGSLSIYGILGIILYCYRYYYVFKAFKNFNVPNYIFDTYRIEVIIVYGIGSFMVSAILFKFYSIFAELIYGWMYIEYSVLIGIFLGLIKLIKFKSEITDYTETEIIGINN